MMTKAPEPTDIIWENRHRTLYEIFWREVFAYGIVIVILLASFVFIYLLTLQQIKLSETFPAVDCTSIQDAYGDQLDKYAYGDFEFLKRHPGL
jgi:hypothetical protein